VAERQFDPPVAVVIPPRSTAAPSETAMFRYKVLIGRGLRARSLPAQKSEARAGCAVLNRMTRLGMPVSRRVA
jgi:hypothetical protein